MGACKRFLEALPHGSGTPSRKRLGPEKPCGFESHRFRVEIKCKCEGKPRIGYAEFLMAKELGLDLKVVHAWSDVYETFLDQALDDQDGADAYYAEHGW